LLKPSNEVHKKNSLNKNSPEAINVASGEFSI
jgi:hypothetical protein